MRKILIADDEQLVRASLRSMLEELPLPLQIVGEAANGEELLELLQQQEPDLAFVDIRMPKLSGLEAIKCGKELSPYTSWVILSGFSEFQYAQEALRLGAMNYLLKPASPEELEQVIQTWLQQHVLQNATLSSQFESHVISMYNGLRAVDEAEASLPLENSVFTATLFCMDSCLSEDRQAEQRLHFSHALRECAKSFFSRHIRIAIFTLPTGELITIGSWKEAAHVEIQSYFERIRELLTQIHLNQTYITAVKTEDCNSFTELLLHIKTASQRMTLRPLVGLGRCLHSTELSSYTKDSTLLQLSQALMRVYESYKMRSYVNYMKAATDIESITTQMEIPERMRQNVLIFLMKTIQLEKTVNEDWLKKLQLHGNTLLKCEQKQPRADLVEQAISFIDQHYMDNISIGQIAEKLQVTPNYLSSLFHKKTGITFTKYIAKTRILRAKELLLNQNLQVQQVAEQVGYYSTRHFTKLFTEFVGCYPSEFRNQLQQLND